MMEGALTQDGLQSFRVNGYPVKEIEKQILAKLDYYTSSFIKEKLASLQTRLSQETGKTIYLSIGENCGPAKRMKAAGLHLFGSNFFDNIVCSTSSFIKIIEADFSDILSISNLSVKTWEGNDSVCDGLYGVLYHHCFHLNPIESEKSRYDNNGKKWRAIEERDIPLFLAQVRSQYEYLRVKFRMVMRSPIRKILVSRKVDGRGYKKDEIEGIERALLNFGAQNCRLISIETTDPISGINQTDSRYYRIPERAERWGDLSDWQVFGKSVE